MLQPFWETKQLKEMSAAEWELLCDHCGRCCLHKVVDEENGAIYFTGIACKQYDLENDRCRDYARRSQLVPECVVLTADNISRIIGLPKTCAYRLLYEGKSLPAWHPLLSGDKSSVRKAGMSIHSFAIAETDIDLDYLAGFVLDSDL